MKCPKCNSEMQEGFQYDERSSGVAEWVEGAPKRSFWLGISTTGHDRREIRIFRCQSCGFLESYAK